MGAIINEIYVSLDGLEYTKLDLHKNEPINAKHTKKDLQDLSKIFAPYSQGFDFPATPKNRAAFGFFGDTDVIKINRESKFSAKSYINGVLSNTGFIKLTSLSYKHNKPLNFTGSFVTTMANLKDRIGDDYISELAGEPVLTKWSIEGVQDKVRSSHLQVIDGVNVRYFVPLVSTNRVWSYDLTDNSPTLDNIAYNPVSELDGNNVIRPEELRPVIYYSAILDFIKKKYGLTIISPLEEREEYKDLTVWCNAERLSTGGFSVLPINNAFGSLKSYDRSGESFIPDPKKYTITTNLTDNSFNVTKLAEPFNGDDGYIEEAFQFRVNFDGVVVTGGEDNPEVDIQYIRKSDDVILKAETFSLDTPTSFSCVTQLDDALFGGGNSLEFYIKVNFKQPTSWSGCSFRIFFRYYKEGFFNIKYHAWYYYDSLANNNSSEVSTDSIDLFESLPKIKVIDFLNSHFKAFNISILDTSPDNENLYWLTPEDINSSGKVYSKAVLDYTRYVNSKTYNKEKPNDFNYYNFKHATSKYFSNVKYAEAFGLEYGQAVYPEVKPSSPSEFKVETGFSIIPPVALKGATGVVTAYGFTDDDAEIIETGETRYTPNYDELTVFYAHGSVNCAALGLLGLVQIETAPWTYTEVLGVYALTSYKKVMPWSKNGHSFGFSVLKYNNDEQTNSLYLKYYSEQTLRLLDANVLSQKFTLILPPNELYLNEETTIQGAGATPSGFRLQNDIIIGENRFSIVDATIDQTTGITKLTLLNY